MESNVTEICNKVDFTFLITAEGADYLEEKNPLLEPSVKQWIFMILPC